jgi:hypothetical protein
MDGRHLSSVVLVALVASVACGRIGYEALAGPGPDAGGGPDAGADRSTPVDASGPGDGPGGGDASDDRSALDGAPDAPPMADEAGGSDAGDAAPDGAADASGCTAAALPGVDYCATLPFLPRPPVIDGKIDCTLPLRDLAPIAWTGGAVPPDATAQYAVAWRPEGLYFFVQVHDPSLVPASPTGFTYQGDAVELFMDSDGVFAAPPAYDNPGARQFIVAAPPAAQSSVAWAQVWFNTTAYSTWTSTQFGAYGLADGYAVEAFVTGPDLGLGALALAAGGRVGMDLSIDVSYPSDQGPDAGGSGNRLGQYFLQVASPDAGGGLPPFDPRAFCVPALAGM